MYCNEKKNLLERYFHMHCTVRAQILHAFIWVSMLLNQAVKPIPLSIFLLLFTVLLWEVI